MGESKSKRRAQRLATVTTSELYHDDRPQPEPTRPTLSQLAATLGVVLTAERLIEAVPEDAEPLVVAVSPGELLDASTLHDDD